MKLLTAVVSSILLTALAQEQEGVSCLYGRRSSCSLCPVVVSENQVYHDFHFCAGDCQVEGVGDRQVCVPKETQLSTTAYMEPSRVSCLHGRRSSCSLCPVVVSENQVYHDFHLCAGDCQVEGVGDRQICVPKENLASEPHKCSAKVPGGRCLLVGYGECWCEDAKIEDCSCNKPGGCPQGQYGEHAGWELCGYEEGYEGTYFPVTKEVAEVFGYRYGNNPSCAHNSLYWGSVHPLRCPKHEQHCKNGFCRWLTQKGAWNRKSCGGQVCCTAFVRCTNMEEAGTIKTTTESNYKVTPLPPMEANLKLKLPQSSKMIYLGEGWKYFKIPIPAGNFKITGPKIAEVCKQYGMEVPCSCAKSCYKQKQCVETAHTARYCTSNMIRLQQATTRKGYKATDENHLQHTFVYSTADKDKDGVDGACGYWPSYYCHQGEETESNGVNKFALCTIQG